MTTLYQKDKRAKYGNLKRMFIRESGKKDRKFPVIFKYVWCNVDIDWHMTSVNAEENVKAVPMQSYAGHYKLNVLYIQHKFLGYPWL